MTRILSFLGALVWPGPLSQNNFLIVEDPRVLKMIHSSA
jgi:hypothetical protein